MINVRLLWKVRSNGHSERVMMTLGIAAGICLDWTDWTLSRHTCASGNENKRRV